MKTTTTTTTPAIITAENVKTIGERIAIRAVKTVLDRASRQTEKTANKGGGQYTAIYKLYCDLIHDINILNRDSIYDENGSFIVDELTQKAYTEQLTKHTISDGYDIASTAICFLCGYIGKTLEDTAENGTDKDGNPITIKRACFRAVNKYIMDNRQRQYKFTYLSEFENGEETGILQVPFEWDTPTITDYTTITQIITLLKLSDREKLFLTYRLRGKSLNDIAECMNIKRDTLNAYAKRIKDKAKQCENLAPYIEKLKK